MERIEETMTSIGSETFVPGLVEIGSDAVLTLRDYFKAETTPADTGKKADRALTLLGRINGMQSTRLKAMALQLQVCKAIGIRGEALRPLLAEIAPGSYASGEPHAKIPGALESTESTSSGPSMPT